MNKTTLAFSSLLLFTVVSSSFGQYSIQRFDLNGAIGNWYDSVFAGSNPELYEGSFYEMPGRTLESHPFLGAGQWVNGMVDFRGQVYENIPMIYDLMNSKLVIRNTNLMADRREFLLINQLQVARFEIEDFLFERYDGPFSPPMGAGFYYVIYRGNRLSLISHRTKTSRISLDGITFDVQAKYYIENEAGYVQVKNKRDFFRQYPDHKKAIKRFLRSYQLKIKEGRDTDFRRLVSFCEQLEGY